MVYMAFLMCTRERRLGAVKSCIYHTQTERCNTFLEQKMPCLLCIMHACIRRRQAQAGCWTLTTVSRVPMCEFTESMQHITGQCSTAHQHCPTRQTKDHCTAQHSTAQHSTAQHSTAQHSTAEHGSTEHSTAEHGTAEHGTAEHGSTG